MFLNYHQTHPIPSLNIRVFSTHLFLQNNYSCLYNLDIYENWLRRLQGMGFERGWGDTASRVLEMMNLLSDILHAPDPSTLETFLGRVPMVFNVVILSVHGYFGQANVLGLPDTGGQVIISQQPTFEFVLTVTTSFRPYSHI